MDLWLTVFPQEEWAGEDIRRDFCNGSTFHKILMALLVPDVLRAFQISQDPGLVKKLFRISLT